MPPKGPSTIVRNGLEKVTESSGLGKGLTFKRFGEKRFWERWSTEKYGQYKAAQGMQIGGQSPQMGPDILKFIKQHDPQNSSGAVKDALEIMQKLQDKSTTPSDLFSSIQPLQSILGGGLYGKMKSAGAAAKASQKIKQPKKKNEDDPLEPEPVPATATVEEIIAEAMALCTDPDDQLLVSELLDQTEIALISDAFYKGGIYASAQPNMPICFVNGVNYIIPILRTTTGQGAAVS